MNRVVLVRELPFAQNRMYKLMACPAQHRKSARQFSFIESAVNLTLSVPGSWNQVMPGQFRISPLAEFTPICIHLAIIRRLLLHRQNKTFAKRAFARFATVM